MQKLVPRDIPLVTIRSTILPLAAAALLAAALSCRAAEHLPATDGDQAPSPTRIEPTEPPPASPTPRPTEVPPTPVLEVPTKFSDEGRTLYIESESLRLGLDTLWGGAIRELWYQGDNLINTYDGGRLAAVAFYDSRRPPASSHPNDTGWNPTPSDRFDHTNRPLETDFSDGELYVRARYLQWFPDDKGGGPGAPVATDIIVESWVRFFTDPHTILLRYRLTNESDRAHGVHAQEFPFVYVRTPYPRYVSYIGDDPWSRDRVFVHDIPMDEDVHELAVASERWGALVNEEDHGLLFWAPQSYPNFTYKYFDNPGPAENPSLYLQPRAFLEIAPRASIESQAFFLVGHWQDSRERVYQLREHFSFPDVMNPFGFVDSPTAGSTVSGELGISGWAIDDRGIDRIEIDINGEVIGEARYGTPRPDVEQNHPGMPNAPNYGYAYTLDTSAFTNGSHVLQVIAVDAAGNTSRLIPGELELTFEN